MIFLSKRYLQSDFAAIRPDPLNHDCAAALTFFSVDRLRYLPIVEQFAKEINLVETINTMVKNQMQLQPGHKDAVPLTNPALGRQQNKGLFFCLRCGHDLSASH